MGIIGSFLFFIIPCFLFVYHLVAAICRGIKDEDNEFNLVFASIAMSVIVILVVMLMG